MPLFTYDDPAIAGIYDEVANLSGAFEVFFHKINMDGSLYMYGTDPSIPYRVGAAISLAPFGTDSQNDKCPVKVDFYEASDLLALEAAFADYVEYDRKIREGLLAHQPASFCYSGAYLAFRLFANPSIAKFRSTPAVCDYDETHINNLQIGAMAGEQFRPVANMSLFKGRHSALCVAHDLAVLKAMIEQMPVEQFQTHFALRKKLLIKQDYVVVCEMINGVSHYRRVPKNRDT